MAPLLASLSRRLDRLGARKALALGVCAALVIGEIDYLTGYEVGMGLFYLGPVALAAWGAGRWPGVFVAALCCVIWYVADWAAGAVYSHPAIPVWNALIRFGSFLIVGLLLTTLRQRLRALKRLATTDALTGLFSRHALGDRLRHDIALTQRRQSALTLAYVDVDDFKLVNDTHGHAQGDHLLQLVGSVLMRSTRKSDTAARVGGDEFVVVMPDTDGQGAAQVIQKIAREFQDAFGASHLQATCSIGVVTFQDTALLSPSRAMAVADELMYRVKRKGKDAVEFAVWGSAGRGASDLRSPSTAPPPPTRLAPPA